MNEIGVLIILGLVAIAGLIYAYESNEDHNRLVTKWSYECREMGGVVQLTGSNRAECFVNSRQVVVKGYEEYMN